MRAYFWSKTWHVGQSPWTTKTISCALILIGLMIRGHKLCREFFLFIRPCTHAELATVAARLARCVPSITAGLIHPPWFIDPMFDRIASGDHCSACTIDCFHYHPKRLLAICMNKVSLYIVLPGLNPVVDVADLAVCREQISLIHSPILTDNNTVLFLHISVVIALQVQQDRVDTAGNSACNTGHQETHNVRSLRLSVRPSNIPPYPILLPSLSSISLPSRCLPFFHPYLLLCSQPYFPPFSIPPSPTFLPCLH